jgi:hypothetical protein
MEESFASIGPPWWDDRPVAIVGNGPSLKGFDVERLRPFHVLAVKGAMFNIPFAKAGFGLDIPRYHEWREILGTLSYPVFWATVQVKFLGELPHAKNLQVIRRVDISDLSDDPSAICSGGTSGFGAVNLAWLKRGRRMLLLGFDYNADQGGYTDRRAYVEQRPQDQDRWIAWAKNFNKLKRRTDALGLTIVNASPTSRITAFPRMDIDAALKEFL